MRARKSKDKFTPWKKLDGNEFGIQNSMNLHVWFPISSGKEPSSSFSEPNVKGTVVKPQGVEDDNVSLKWKVLYLVKKENNVSDDVTHSTFFKKNKN
ncbi:unnamed protein product [Brassica rapa subsp. trilocularis]